MLGIISPEKDPAFNLATEEYLLKELKDDIFYLYVNEPCIVVGKHQNTLAEIDYDYILKNNIPVYRRLSGGGTVYHDTGNLNFCFITNEKEGSLIDFDKHSTPIVKALENMRLKVTVGKRHDLSINGKKITGTASHVFRQRAMHHGTLLFSADLTVLNKCLSGDYDKFHGKSVRSVKSEVTNISEQLDHPMSMEEFKKHIFDFVISYLPSIKEYRLSEIEKKEIEKLVKEKYEKWEWNYGYSPVYEIERSIKFENTIFNSHVKVEKGLITELKLNSSEPSQNAALKKLSTTLLNIQHSKSALNSVIPSDIILTPGQLFNLLF